MTVFDAARARLQVTRATDEAVKQGIHDRRDLMSVAMVMVGVLADFVTLAFPLSRWAQPPSVDDHASHAPDRCRAVHGSSIEAAEPVTSGAS